jgi:hypothetical protein
MIRDQALFVSSLLVEKLGGPSVRPYQPDGLYKDMLFSNMTNYAQDKGEGCGGAVSARSETNRHAAGDANSTPRANPAACARSRTNTPLQALNLMNDATYVEAG